MEAKIPLDSGFLCKLNHLFLPHAVPSSTHSYWYLIRLATYFFIILIYLVCMCICVDVFVCLGTQMEVSGPLQE